VLLTGLVISAGCGPEQEDERPEARAAVETFMVEAMDFPVTVQGIGSLESTETVDIRSEIAGVIAEIRFEEGQQVSAGDLLFVLRDEKLQQELDAGKSSLKAARVAFEQARQSFERFSTLFEERIISAEEHERARTEMETARAEVQRLTARLAFLEEQLQETRIRAPMDGVLSETRFDPGSYVAAGDELVTLFTEDALNVAFWVPETAMGRVRPGQPVTVTVPAAAEPMFTGEVVFVSPSVDVQTRTLLVRATVEDDSGVLMPGVFARAAVTVDVRRQRPTVPEEALVATREGYYAYVIDRDSEARRRAVMVGSRRAGRVEIAEGLRAGEIVIRSGQMQLSEGDVVEVVSGPEPHDSHADPETGVRP
jgi:RND family efflux transporter MFP subunit